MFRMNIFEFLLFSYTRLSIFRNNLQFNSPPIHMLLIQNIYIPILLVQTDAYNERNVRSLGFRMTFSELY